MPTMVPGSPTPWENGLRGVADAMQELNAVQLPTLASRLDMGAPGIGGGRVVNNYNTTYQVTGNYRYQDQYTLTQEVRHLSLLGGGA